MIQRHEIKNWCDRVASEFHPQRIILFGSYASGSPTRDSDVDILIVMPLARGRRDVHQAADIRARVPAKFTMDVIVRTPQQVTRRLADGDSFITSVVRDGRTMYENKHS